LNTDTSTCPLSGIGYKKVESDWHQFSMTFLGRIHFLVIDSVWFIDNILPLIE